VLFAPRPGHNRVLLVAVRYGNSGPVDASLRELAQLTVTAGGEVVDRIIQVRDKINPAYFIGRGKSDELRTRVIDEKISAIIFNNRLSPAQERNLEQALGCPIVDRAGLILSIFAQRARTQEAQLQIEIAQLSYLQTRLHGRGKTMMQQVARVGAQGPGGTRGPGEKQLEYDRRYLRNRMLELKKKLRKVVRRRQEQRKGRQDRPLFALVGYTNAGKSALLNGITGSGQLVEDKLFATLDPKVCRYRLPDGNIVLLADTVGFIRELPTQLIAAFRSTLEEVRQADILLHVIDVAEDGVEERVTEVIKTLRELAADRKPLISVLNKIDLVANKIHLHRYRKYPNSVALSAKTGAGFDQLAAKIAELLQRHWVPARVYLDPAQMACYFTVLDERSVFKERKINDQGVEEIELSTNPELLESLRGKGIRIELLGNMYRWRDEAAE